MADAPYRMVSRARSWPRLALLALASVLTAAYPVEGQSRGQIAVVSSGADEGKLRYMALGSDFVVVPPGGPNAVNSTLNSWASIKLLTTTPGGGWVAVAGDNTPFNYNLPTALVPLESDLGRHVNAHKIISLVSVSSSDYLIVSESPLPGTVASSSNYPSGPISAVRSALSGRRNVDAVALYQGGWVVAAEGTHVQNGLSGTALWSTIGSLAQGERVEDIATTESGGWALLTDKELRAEGVDCATFTDWRLLTWLDGRRTVTCDRVTADPPISLGLRTGKIDLMKFLVGTTANHERSGDEPYLYLFPIRAQLGRGNQKVEFHPQSSRRNIKNADDWATARASVGFPKPTGELSFASVQPYEIFGVVTVLLEEDFAESADMWKIQQEMQREIAGELASAFNNTSAKSANPGLSKAQAEAITRETLHAFRNFAQSGLSPELAADAFMRVAEQRQGWDFDDFGDVDVIAYIYAPGLSDDEVIQLYTGGKSWSGLSAWEQANLSILPAGNFRRDRSCCLIDMSDVSPLPEFDHGLEDFMCTAPAAELTYDPVNCSPLPGDSQYEIHGRVRVVD